MRFHTNVLLVISCLTLASCGGDSGGGDVSGSNSGSGNQSLATTELITYHPSGRIAGRGQVLVGTSIRHGAWSDYFDQDDAQTRWTGSYDHEVIDGAQPWTEWNQDSSVRIDSTDR